MLPNCESNSRRKDWNWRRCKPWALIKFTVCITVFITWSIFRTVFSNQWPSHKPNQQPYFCKCLFFIWTHDVAHFHHAALQKFSLSKWWGWFGNLLCHNIAFTAASLYGFALVNNICCDVRLLFNSSTFCSFCSTSNFLNLPWCFVS